MKVAIQEYIKHIERPIQRRVHYTLYSCRKTKTPYAYDDLLAPEERNLELCIAQC